MLYVCSMDRLHNTGVSKGARVSCYLQPKGIPRLIEEPGGVSDVISRGKGSANEGARFGRWTRVIWIELDACQAPSSDLLCCVNKLHSEFTDSVSHRCSNMQRPYHFRPGYLLRVPLPFWDLKQTPSHI